ncbi:MAG: glycosyltransferase [Prochlorothrix sp.]|nr:glycosyltransferase [Prochlorothrix sp.]
MSVQALFQILLLGLICTSLGFYGASALATYLFFSRRRTLPEFTPQPVSILIPVRGVDEGALANWDSFCNQDYGTYEVLFGVMDADDPAVPILRGLTEQYPDRVRLLTNLPARGINHQISNLSYLVEAAQFEQIIFADSDIRVTPDYLQWVTAPLADSGTGVVTCGYLDHQPSQWGAALASLGRAVDFIPSVLLARALDGKLKFALGPTIATRKSVLESFGGLQHVYNRIGSDFHIGRLAVSAGYRVELSAYILENDCGQETPVQVFQRELRWSRTIRWNRGSQYYGLVLTHGTVYGLLLVLVSGLQPWAWAVWGITLVLRWLQAGLSFWMLRSPGLWGWFWLLPLRDWMTFAIWLGGSYGQTVFWRGRWLQVGDQGTLEEVSKS